MPSAEVVKREPVKADIQWVELVGDLLAYQWVDYTWWMLNGKYG
jgi:hypothetical protein